MGMKRRSKIGWAPGGETLNTTLDFILDGGTTDAVMSRQEAIIEANPFEDEDVKTMPPTKRKITVIVENV